MTLFALFGGFGEFDEWSVSVHRRLLNDATGDGSVCILPMAYADDDFITNHEVALYERIGVRASVVPVRAREDAERAENADAVNACALIFLHGGMPHWMVDTLDGTAVWDAVAAALSRGASYAGTSGGIACLGGTVPRPTDDEPPQTKWIPGLGTLPGAVIAPHWDSQAHSYFRGLFEKLPDTERVFAVDERTAAVGDGTSWSVAGEGAVHVIHHGRESAWRYGEQFDVPLKT